MNSPLMTPTFETATDSLKPAREDSLGGGESAGDLYFVIGFEPLCQLGIRACQHQPGQR